MKTPYQTKVKQYNGQREVNAINAKEKRLLQTFKATTNLNHALYNHHPPTRPNITDHTKQLLILAKQEKSTPQPEYLQAQVAALSNFAPHQSNPKTQQLISRQRAQRRQRHKKVISQFQQKMEQIFEMIEMQYQQVRKGEVEECEFSRKDIEECFQSWGDQVLLGKGIEFIQEMGQKMNEFKQYGQSRLSKLQKNLSKLQSQREQRSNNLHGRTLNKIIDIAFMLQKEAVEEMQKQTNQFLDTAHQNQKKNQIFIENSRQKQKSRWQKWDQILKEKQKRWRQLHYNNHLFQSQSYLLSSQHNHSSTLAVLLTSLSTSFMNAHHFHKSAISNLLKSIFPNQLNQNITAIQLQNAKVQQNYDKIFQSLVKEKDSIQQRGKQRKDRLSMQLRGTGFKQQQGVQEDLKKLQEQVNEVRTKQNAKLSQLMSYVEKYDSLQFNIVLNIHKFQQKLCKTNQKQVKDWQKQVRNYEMQKAKLLDQDQQRIDVLQQQLVKGKVDLKNSHHHPKLEENIKNCFSIVDQIQKEYRGLHTKNQELVERHPKLIQTYFQNAEKQLAEVFQLYEESRRAQLVERSKKSAEEAALKIIQKEQRKKAIQAEKLAQQAKSKKGGKAPPNKPKDPKKAALQLEQRKQQLMKEMKYENIPEFKKGEKVWLQFVTSKQRAQKMYQKEDQNEQQKVIKNQEQKKEQQQEQLPVDFMQPSPTSFLNQPIIPSLLIPSNYLTSLLQNKRQNSFKNLIQTKQSKQIHSKVQDKRVMQESITMLDERLKKLYPTKGKLQVEIYQVRAGQITNHKKKYQRHARVTKQKIDLQTEHFNYLLEQCLESMKKHAQQQKYLKQSLSSANSISKFQGLQSSAKDNQFKFSQKINEIVQTLKGLADTQIKAINKKNGQFIKQCKNFQDGGEYSSQQTHWYQDMLQQINSQVNQQQQKRNTKIQEIEDYTKKRTKALLQTFDKQYNVAIEELSAKDGTGKKYGRPKRLAQQKLRAEMNKCQKAQQNLQAMVKQLQKLLTPAKEIQNYTSKIKMQLTKIRNCTYKYGIHIDAFRTDMKVQQLPRISYNQSKFEPYITQSQVEEDQKRKKEQLNQLGPLGQQKQNKKYVQFMQEIEKLVREDAQKIYVGDKAKLLTGGDKIPDWLRNYVKTMRRNTQQFRLTSIGNLRQLNDKVLQLVENLPQCIFNHVYNKHQEEKDKKVNLINKDFGEVSSRAEKDREKHLRDLRPNLSNPMNAGQLKNLYYAQKQRYSNYLSNIEQFRNNMQQAQFKLSTHFFKGLLNNFQFLCLYYDSLLNYQNFVKLPGDEQKQKIHMDLLQIIKMRQKQKLKDQDGRQISKWQGLQINSFDLQPNYKLQYVRDAPVQQQPKDPKKGKKEAKDPKKQKDQPPAESTHTKEIKTLKTDTHLNAFQWRNDIFKNYRKKFVENIRKVRLVCDEQKLKQNKFYFKWQQMVKSLNNPFD